MSERITKKELAEKLNSSRPTLDKYLANGFPTKITSLFTHDEEYERIVLENEIRLVEYKLKKLGAKIRRVRI